MNMHIILVNEGLQETTEHRTGDSIETTNCNNISDVTPLSSRQIQYHLKITGWTAKERTGSYRDTMVKTIALTTMIFIANG